MNLSFTRRVFVIAAGAALCACHRDAEDESASRPTVSATTVVVRAQPFIETVDAIGTVSGRAGHVASLSAPSAGRVSQVLVTTGQTVQAGQSLIVLDPAPFAASLQSAEAALAAAERAAERQQRLASEGIVPRKDAEQAAAEVAKARADAAEAKRASELATLQAPISGVITRLNASLGASVDASQPLVEITDASALDVLLNVTPTQAATVRPAQKVALSAGQSADGETLGVGSVVDVSSTVDSITRGVAVRVQAPTTRRPLRIGETVFGSIAVATIANSIVVPLEALVPEGDAFHVFVVDANGIAHARDVTVGARSRSGARVLDGLRAGERIVTYGAYGVQDSAKVVPFSADSVKADTGTTASGSFAQLALGAKSRSFASLRTTGSP
jgi:RND family efflux transporter MFP subunit